MSLAGYQDYENAYRKPAVPHGRAASLPWGSSLDPPYGREAPCAASTPNGEAKNRHGIACVAREYMLGLAVEAPRMGRGRDVPAPRGDLVVVVATMPEINGRGRQHDYRRGEPSLDVVLDFRPTTAYMPTGG